VGGERDFHGETRSNDTHASTTNPDARLHGKGKETKLSYIHQHLHRRHFPLTEPRAKRTLRRTPPQHRGPLAMQLTPLSFSTAA
jgi:hypothetical protein